MDKHIIDNIGLPIYNSNDLVNMIYRGNSSAIFSALCVYDSHIKKFNKHSPEQPINEYQSLDITPSEFDSICQMEWLMPEEYKNIDIMEFLTEKIHSCASIDPTVASHRAKEELQEFSKRNLTNLLRFMIYLVDTMKEHGVVWGVGRGSSTSSLVLFLIGVHKINPILYELDWRDFLK